MDEAGPGSPGPASLFSLPPSRPGWLQLGSAATLPAVHVRAGLLLLVLLALLLGGELGGLDALGVLCDAGGVGLGVSAVHLLADLGGGAVQLGGPAARCEGFGLAGLQATGAGRLGPLQCGLAAAMRPAARQPARPRARPGSRRCGCCPPAVAGWR